MNHKFNRRYRRMMKSKMRKDGRRSKANAAVQSPASAHAASSASFTGLDMLEPRVLLSGDVGMLEPLGNAPEIGVAPAAPVVVLEGTVSAVIDGNESNFQLAPVADTATSSSIVRGRHVFYNNSSFDGNHNDANDEDDNAIASDKVALRPGETGSFANYTSYSRGLNGVMVDIDRLGSQDPVLDDFEFKVGNDSSPSTWQQAPAPMSIVVRRGAGDNGSDRVSIIWPDNTIENQWLQVTVKATDNTRLAADDVFYFGNAVAHTGGDGGDATMAMVDVADVIGARQNATSAGVMAEVDNHFDFDRDGAVNLFDLITARNNVNNHETALHVMAMPEAPDVDEGVVLHVEGDLIFSGEEDDYVELPHNEDLELSSGTIAISFVTEDVWRSQALFSKDWSGNGEGGHLSAFVDDAKVKLRFQSADGERWLATESGSVEAGKQHHVAITFGEDGFWVHLDGRVRSWNLEFKQNLATNKEPLAIGAYIGDRSESDPQAASNEFHGVIQDFRIYDTQFDQEKVAELAGLSIEPLTEPTVIDGVLVGTLDDDASLDAGAHGVNIVFGDYGDDVLIANPEAGTIQGYSPSEVLSLTVFANVLNGGHGNDTLQGSEDNDLLVSRADGREPKIAQEWDLADDPYREIDPVSNTYYVGQPIEADDVLIGGGGADVFYFQTLINAKKHIILKHVRSDGTIDWSNNGVAGENDNVHDHWVDGFGDELIADFNREEGDHILIEGHTTEVLSVEYVDSDGDNNVDSTVIHVWSNQANGGAHDEDRLGTITVPGVLLTGADYTVNKTNYGIVETIAELNEAITPYTSTPDDGVGPAIPAVADGEAMSGVALHVGGDLYFSGEHDDFVEIPHSEDLELANGTIAFSFTANEIGGYQALFSKDASGQEYGGHLTALVVDGRLKVRLQRNDQGNDTERWLDTPAGTIVAGQEYHIAITFGEAGFWLYLDGQMRDWDVNFKQNLVMNPEPLAIGANIWGRSADDDPNDVDDEFNGVIRDFTIYSSQYDDQQVAALAGQDVEPPLSEPTVIDSVLVGTLEDDADLDAGEAGVNAVFGDYGNDVLTANPNAGGIRGYGPSETLSSIVFANVLNGGHGNDTLQGSDNNDLLVSRADGREPKIAQEWDFADDPYREINLESNTYYVGQPIEADDVLIGGGGADVFYFQTLINAKKHIILKHVRSDGTIDWSNNGVAGENDNVHDHWVDGFGDELIADFNREEGDHILIEGHTTEVLSLKYVDSDGDHNVDSTVIHVWSNQANGGAHDEDRLGTITVPGVLLTGADYTVNKTNYGIVETIAELDEAISPYTSTPDDGVGPVIPAVADGEAMAGVVLHVGGDLLFSDEHDDFVEIAHSEDLELTDGTISFTFRANEIGGYQALFSKDASGRRHGGHLTAWVVDGRLKVRFQTNTSDRWFETQSGTIVAGQEYHTAVTFGENGFWLYLDGQMRDWDAEFTQGIERNHEPVALGADISGRSIDDDPNDVEDEFNGVIRDFTILNSQYDDQQVAALAGHEGEPPLTEPTVIDDVLVGTLEDDLDLDAGDAGVNVVFGDYGDDVLIANPTGGVIHGYAPSEALSSIVFANVLNGGHGNDTLQGSDNNDLLISRADGREPKIAQEWDLLDDPYGEINVESNTYYVGQPIEADDVLIGGGGADVFYFQTLINAKKHIILKHVRSDGTINWGRNGVAGENDNVHDHWVDGFGDELIADFNRDEGDHILIEGHTTEVLSVEYVDSDGDNNFDSTVIHVWSNQANGGAHDEDRLGTITVPDVLLTGDDYTVNKRDYGIVPTIAELDEAITPYTSTPDDGVGPDIPVVADGVAMVGAVLHTGGDLYFSGERDDFVEIEHSEDLELANGTISFSFIANEVDHYQALFSKDASGSAQGGHLTAFVVDGRLKVRFQSTSTDRWLDTEPGTVVAGQAYHVALTFGDNGFWLYLDGQMNDSNLEFKQTLVTNQEPLALGANIWGRSADDDPNDVDHEFNGVISDFTIYNSQFSDLQVADLAGQAVQPSLPETPVLYGTLGDDADLDAGDAGVNVVFGDYGNDVLTANPNAGVVRGNAGVIPGKYSTEALSFAVFGNVLDGGHGNDTLQGSDNNDLLISRADGREPKIAQEWDLSDDPFGEINTESNTYYVGQPIEADDVLIGGGGADVFYFQTLINAKEHIIRKHVRSDGTIDWSGNGVAGENDNVHDHWVDGFGDELIADFNRDEGDHILIEGHTTEVLSVEYVDSDGDNNVDATVIHVWSNQANGGAHDEDLLGTITVPGVLLTGADYTVNKTNYGIVKTIAEIDEAITPYTSTPDDGVGPEIPAAADGEAMAGVVLHVGGDLSFSGENEDFIEATHQPKFELANGTVSFRFTANEIGGYQALFSKDASGNAQGGHLTAWVVDGRVKVRLQSISSERWLDTQAGTIVVGQEYHVAITFGEAGFWLYLNGQMQDWNQEFTQGIEANHEPVALGASISGRSADDDPNDVDSEFNGVISDFTIHNSQYDDQQVAALAGAEGEPPLAEPTVIDGVLVGTLEDDADLDAGDAGVNAVFGDYGDDVLTANPSAGGIRGYGHSEALSFMVFANVLNGGHGNDTLQGSDNNDLLISRADGREPKIAQEWDLSDDPYGEINVESNTYYVGQPIEADDVLIGGGGADVFYFQTLINAKKHIILKHVRSDGTINWGMHGVAGENDNVHDHWVDGFGDELIADFNREEGDHILIEGHTTEVLSLEYVDSDGDNNVDTSVIHVWSNQANGGAHDEDRLGTITVPGVLLTGEDYTVNKRDYGIVPTIAELDEAITPYTSTPDDGVGPVIPAVADGEAMAGVVLHAGGELSFSGENDDFVEIAHSEALELANGTISFTFIANEIGGYQALFSKDASGQAQGGHMTAWVVDGRLKVRFQTTSTERWLDTQAGTIVAGQAYHAAITFGEAGFWLYLDGQMKDWNIEFTQNLMSNHEPLALGASISRRSADDDPNDVDNEFNGVIRDFTIFNSQYDDQQVAALADHEGEPPLDEPTVIDGVLVGTLEDDLDLDAGDAGVNAVFGDYGNDVLTASPDGGVIRGYSSSEALSFVVFANVLNGGHGNDTLQGSDQNDLLVSRADGREPKIAQEWDLSDDPYGEINVESNTYYVGQPIEADDVLIGGGGADVFYFQTLINAKKHIILKHVRSDGTINWSGSGVAGENDNVHDHWVDGFGDELIADFNREEGDHILIEGHTTEVLSVEYIDSDGDHNLDTSVIYVWSNQANGGAHDEDRLGTITVPGVFLTADDYTVNKRDYGIVPTIAELDEAITPYTSTPDDGVGPVIPAVDDGEQIPGVVLHIGAPLTLTGENDDYIEVAHNSELELTSGTIAVSFVAEDIFGYNALFSKDWSGLAEGGHLSAFVVDGRLKIRFQSTEGDRWLDTEPGTIEAGQEHHMAITFGEGGFHLYLDGQLLDSDLEYKQNLALNMEPIAIGAYLGSRSEGQPKRADDELKGVISDFRIYDTQFDALAVAQLASTVVMA